MKRGDARGLRLLRTGLRREMIRWVTEARREQTRLTRVERAIDELRRRSDPAD